jgi:hypothetical protein
MHLMDEGTNIRNSLIFVIFRAFRGFQFSFQGSQSSRSPPVVWRGRTVPDAGSRHAYNGFWQGMGLSVFVYPFLPIRFCVSVLVANKVLSRQSYRQSSQIIPAPAAAVT